MPTEVTKFRARDGAEFNTHTAAAQHELLLDEIAEIMQPLGDTKIDHHDFVQHNPATVVRCRVRILKLAAKMFPDEEHFRHDPPEAVHPS
jgi:hypothetical protein